MDQEQILQQFKETGALLDGHFELSSGRHSPVYLQCAQALKFPYDAARYGRVIAEHFTDAGIQTVAAPAIGGLIIGYEVARALNVRFIWTERKQGEMTLRRGFHVRPGEKILVVEDVITTGGSVRECIGVLEKLTANVVSAASIIDRSNGEADVGVPRISLVRVDVPDFDPAECPLCRAGTKAVKPGSRES